LVILALVSLSNNASAQNTRGSLLAPSPSYNDRSQRERQDYRQNHSAPLLPPTTTQRFGESRPFSTQPRSQWNSFNETQDQGIYDNSLGSTPSWDNSDPNW
jgi:hypothetical protein